MLSPAERAFHEEVREKKRAANGIFSRTGKRGYVGKMYLPHELLRGKEKREYKKSGRCVSWNMYIDIMDYQMFKGLPQDQKKKVLESLREKHKSEDIRKHWKIGSQTFYRIINDLGLKKRNITSSSPKKAVNRVVLKDKEVLQYISSLIDYDTFKQLVYEQQHLLLFTYLKKMEVKELAKIWGTKSSNVYYFIDKLKKLISENEFEPIDLSSQEAAATIEETSVANIQSEGDKDEQQVENRVEDTTDPDNNFYHAPIDRVPAEIEQETRPADEHKPKQKPKRSYGTALSFDGEYTKTQLKQRLLTLVELLEDDERYYKLNVSFTEITELDT